MKILNRIFEITADVFYPNKCISCSEIISSGKHLCDFCCKNIERINTDKLCLTCGLEKEFCSCRKHVYHFNAAVSPFKYEGIAKGAMQNYKFGQKRHYSVFFANEMVSVIQKVFPEIKFDIVCYVPMDFFGIMKRGYDQSELLARGISKIMGIPLRKDVLRCRNFYPHQHTSSYTERFKNIKDKYYTDCRIKAENVLLIDDIKTTGATLDECARLLMFAGADKVYCATALTSIPEKVENG